MTIVRKLLVVDDESGITNAISLLAGTLGFEVMLIDRPPDVLKALHGYRPDVLLLDMARPERDDIAVLMQILCAKVPVRIILASGGEGTVARLARDVVPHHDVRAIRLLPRPYGARELIDALKEV